MNTDYFEIMGITYPESLVFYPQAVDRDIVGATV